MINSSDYSAELKGNYTGALVTRVKSLTQGIYGQVFVSDEIDNAKLFDQNAIVDLSRVASSETKALIMGILVMRLQEHRMAEGGMNKELRHITVLEEAHHLLKRTSLEQTSESSNLLGKSVEMLSQSIAEMRTYGEGFIIADQSPNMLDMSVIRNTNTKIILRLPDFSDRELCGKAAGLDDEQIIELAKLPTGVAAVYQNNWIEPVLCKINHFEYTEGEYKYFPKKVSVTNDKLKKSILYCFLAPIANEKVEYSASELCKRIMESDFAASEKVVLMDALHSNKREIPDICKAVSVLFNTNELLKMGNNATDIETWNDMLLKKLEFDFSGMNEVYPKLVLHCILKQLSIENIEMVSIYKKWYGAMRGENLC